MNYYGTWRLQIWIIEIERRVNFAQNVFRVFAELLFEHFQLAVEVDRSDSISDLD